MKIFVPMLIIVAVLCGSLYAQSDEFEMANNFYEDKDFNSAIRLYESVLNQGYESSALYFNLGNAYFKNGKLGESILYYMRARRLDPADEDIAHNLEFARQFSRVQMEGVELNPINSMVSSIIGNYHLNQLAWLSSIIFILFVGILVVRYGLGIINPFTKLGFTVFLVLLVISFGLTTFKYRSDYLTRRAVIVAEQSVIHTGPSDQSDVELEGAAGLVVEIVDESVEYFNVLFENKRRGWIKKELVAEI